METITAFESLPALLSAQAHAHKKFLQEKQGVHALEIVLKCLNPSTVAFFCITMMNNHNTTEYFVSSGDALDVAKALSAQRIENAQAIINEITKPKVIVIESIKKLSYELIAQEFDNGGHVTEINTQSATVHEVD